MSIDQENTSANDPGANVSPEVFLLSGRREDRNTESWTCWAAVHASMTNRPLITLELELRYDELHPLMVRNRPLPLSGQQHVITKSESLEVDSEKSGMDGDGFNAFSAEDLYESTTSHSKPIRRIARSVLDGDGSGSMELFSILSQINQQLSATDDLAVFLKVVAGIIKDITRFHRVMVYQFDEQWNGQVVAELVEWNQTKDLFQGLNFPATDIPAQARALYNVNKVRVLYDRELPTARLVCRSRAELEKPLDMTHCFLRAMSPIHLEYLANMGVHASMSISITAFGRLWGLIACHMYGNTSMRCSFLVRKLCRLIGEQVSHNIERLSYAARLTARKLIHTPTSQNPSGYIVSKAEDLLGLFEADSGILSVGSEGKILGPMENSQEAIALREYFRSERFETITPSNNLSADFPNLDYKPGFKTVAGVIYIPLSRSGEDFLLFFRRGHLQKVHWAGNPYEKVLEKIEGQKSVLLPRQSFKVWSEHVIGRCKEWSEDQIETAAVLCLVYGKFIEVWREKQQALQTSKLASLLLSNAGHEVRTPLNAVINYLEIALEGQLDHATRENLVRSHTASKSLVYVINDLLDLTRSEQGQDLFRNEPFDLLSTVREAVSMYRSQATRAEVNFSLEEDPDIPHRVLGDQAKIRQVIGNVTANALKYTEQGSVTVTTRSLQITESSCDVAIVVKDTGCGISEQKLDAIFSNFELVEPASQKDPREGDSVMGTGLGLAIVARVVGNMNGQLKAESKIGRGSTFTFIFHFMLPESDLRRNSETLESSQISSSSTRHAAQSANKIDEQSESCHHTHPSSSMPISALASAVEGTNGTSERVWPSDQQHKKNKETSLVDSRTLGGSRNSMTDQLRDLCLTGVHSDGASSIDGLVQSMMTSGTGPQERSDAMAESVHGAISVPNPSRKTLQHQSNTSLLKDRSVRSNSVETGIGDVDDDDRPHHDCLSPPGTRHPIHSDAPDYGDIEPSNYDVSDVSERESRALPEPSLLRSTVAHSHAVPNVRAIKMDKGGVRIPQRYDRNPVNRLTPSFAPHSPTNQKSLGNHEAEKKISSMAKSLNILVAEDDLINRSILQKRLQIDKHHLQLTNDGLDCYDRYAAEMAKYDVVLMDMQMPVLDGLGATRKIRQLEKKCHAQRSSRVPIIAVSASLLESHVQEAINSGIDGWILKPVNFSRLKQLFLGLEDDEIRAADLYSPNSDRNWEDGGWLRSCRVDA